MKVARRKLDAAKRVNRTHSKYSFELTELCLSGLPEQVSSEALMVQCVRGPKLTATEEAEIDEEKLSRGEVLWPGQRLSFVATLYASKTGKEFSAKKYKVSLIGIRPAAFGTTKKLLKELSSAELNVSEFASATDPLPCSLTLPLRGGKTSLTLRFKVVRVRVRVRVRTLTLTRIRTRTPTPTPTPTLTPTITLTRTRTRTPTLTLTLTPTPTLSLTRPPSTLWSSMASASRT